MKNVKVIVAVIFGLVTSTQLCAQTTKHLWQPYSNEPIIQFNQKGQMVVFTYDRLSIYNVETGNVEKTYDLIANRCPYIWPSTVWVDFSDDFKMFRFYGHNKDLSGNRGVFIRFDAEKEKWDTAATYDEPLVYREMDIQGRDIVQEIRKKKFFLYKPNGKKIKEIPCGEYIKIMVGGRYGIYNLNDQNYLYDFSADISKPLGISGGINLIERFPEWLINKNDKNIIFFNPYTNEKITKELDDPTKNVPIKYVKCSYNTFYGNYFYKIVVDKESMTIEDRHNAVPYVIEQYNSSDCSLVKIINISATENENTAKASSVDFIYDGLNLMAGKQKSEQKKREEFDKQAAEKFANKKEAGELAKELLINFRDGGTIFNFSLSSLQARDITNLAYTKKYLSHLKGEVNAIVKFNCGTHIILVVALRNGNSTTFKFVRIHYEGVYRSTKDIATVSSAGSVITNQLSIALSNTGSSIKAQTNKTNLSNGKMDSDTIFAPCGGDW